METHAFFFWLLSVFFKTRKKAGKIQQRIIDYCHFTVVRLVRQTKDIFVCFDNLHFLVGNDKMALAQEKYIDISFYR